MPEGVDGDAYYIPSTATGTYVSGTTIVVDYYYKAKTYTLTVHHYIAGTNESVPLKGSTSGETVADEVTDGYSLNDTYTTSQASADLIDYDIYELVETPADAEGTIEGNTVVTYNYQIIEEDLRITKVAEEDYDTTLSGTEFALYALTGESSTSGDLIDTDDVGDEWTLVGTYTSSDSGVIKLEDLPITYEYRLVETKASEGRMVSEGQWKIEFIYGDYDTTDTSIIDVNGTLVRITAVGNPAAMVLTDDGELLLPNREYYEIPSSGAVGISLFYQVGLIMMGVGLMILVLKKIYIKKGRRYKK